MIIVAIPGASLRPLPFIIFTPNFESNFRIDHIEQTDEKASQMGEMSNTAPCSLHGREEFDEAKDDYHILGGNGEEKVDVDEAIREEPAEGQKDSIDCSRGPNDRDELIGGENDRTDTGSDSAEEKVSQELPRPP
jgi:hypothetical protein